MECNPYLNIHRYLPTKDIKTVISHPKVEIVSFDIFDTLLVRPSIEPSDIFYLLDDRFPEAQKKFSELRLTAEGRMGVVNATLSEIWSFILKSEHIDLELAEAMMQEEVKIETQLLTVREDVREIYQFALDQGKRIIAVSDMYLPTNVLREILRAKGYTGIERIYVSCEFKKRKDNGELYDFVLEAENVTDPSQIVHIGDNYQSDYRIPLDRGITAMHYPSIWDIMLSETSWWKNAFQHPCISEDPFTRLLYSFTFLSAYNAGYRPGANTCFDTIENFVRLYLAPLLVSIALDMINDKTIQAEYQHIYFAARDGYLPMMVYQELGKSTNAITASYLYVSRSSLSYSRYKDFFNFFDQFEPATSYHLCDFVEYFIIDQDLRKKVLGGLSKDEVNLDLSEDPLSARRTLLRFKEELNTYFLRQKDLAEKYYTQIFRDFKDRQLVFDCGYSGSVSAGLMSIQKDMIIDKYYLWQTEQNIKQDKKFGTRTFCRFQSNVPYGINLIIEECFSPVQGSHIGFDEKNGAVPVHENFTCSEKLRTDLSVIKQTTREYVAHFSSVFHGYLNAFPVGKDDVFSDIGRFAFLRSPTAELRIFEHFKFPDCYSRGKNESLSVKIQNFYDQSLSYPTPLSGTGFLLRENYAQIPVRELCSQARLFKLGIHVHLYNKHLFPEIYGYLKSFPVQFDLYLTVTDEKLIAVMDKVFGKTALPNLRQLKILLVDNRGRDVAPWLVNTAEFQSGYDLFCHLHTKESLQYEGTVGRDWRDFLMVNLLHRQAVIDTLNLFAGDAELGVVFPEPFTYISDIYSVAKLRLLGTMGEDKTILQLLSKMGLEGSVERYAVMYSIGTMMWYRPAALKPLFEFGLRTEDFPEEPIDVGGTIAHAIERLPPLVARSIGYHSAFFTEFPIEHRSWLDRQIEQYETVNGKTVPPIRQLFLYGNADMGLKGALKVFLHKNIPFLFHSCAEIHYENPIGVRGALAIYLSKFIQRLLHV